LRSSQTDPDAADRLRLDLFLKRSRLVKRRTLAATLCNNNYVHLNNKLTPPGKFVKVGDKIDVQFAKKRISVEVLSLPDRATKEQNCYQVLEITETDDDLY
jgi:ribosomal 50S subunit-recycling heat shock protein